MRSLPNGSEAIHGFEYQHYVAIERLLEFSRPEFELRPIRITTETLSGIQRQDIEIEYVDNTIVLEQVKKNNSYWKHAEVIDVIRTLLSDYKNHHNTSEMNFKLRFTSNRSISDSSTIHNFFKARTMDEKSEEKMIIFLEAINNCDFDISELELKRIGLELRLPSFGGWDLGDTSYCLKEYLVYKISYIFSICDLPTSESLLAKYLELTIRKSAETVMQNKKTITASEYHETNYKFLEEKPGTRILSAYHNKTFSVQTPYLHRKLSERCPETIGKTIYIGINSGLIQRIIFSEPRQTRGKKRLFSAILVLKNACEIFLLWGDFREENNYAANLYNFQKNIIEISKTHVEPTDPLIVVFTKSSGIDNIRAEKLEILNLEDSSFHQKFMSLVEGCLND